MGTRKTWRAVGVRHASSESLPKAFGSLTNGVRRIGGAAQFADSAYGGHGRSRAAALKVVGPLEAIALLGWKLTRLVRLVSSPNSETASF